MLRATQLHLKKPLLPTLPSLVYELRSKSQFLLETQRTGFGFSLAAASKFSPQDDVDAWVPKSSASSSSQPLQNAKNHHQHLKKSKDPVLSPITSSATAVAVFAGEVDESFCDNTGRIHSGALSTIADIWTSVHVWALAGPNTLHVSVGIDLIMMTEQCCEGEGKRTEESGNNSCCTSSGNLPPKPGERFICVTRVPKLGAKLAFTEFQFFKLPRLVNEDLKLLSATTSPSCSLVDVVARASTRKSREENGQEDHVDDAATNAVATTTTTVKSRSFDELLKDYQSTSPDVVGSLSLAEQACVVSSCMTPFAMGTHEKAFVTK